MKGAIVAKLPVIRLVEDFVVVAGTAVATYQATNSVSDALDAAVAAPAGRSLIALAVSGGASSGLVEGFGILRRAIALLKGVPALVVDPPVNVASTPAQDPTAGKHEATA